MRHQALRFGTLLDFLLDGLAQLGNGRVESIQQLQQIVPSPARPRSQRKRTTNTYYIKSAAGDTRAAMAKLEKLVIGNAEATNLQSGNEVATLEAEAPTASIQ